MLGRGERRREEVVEGEWRRMERVEGEWREGSGREKLLPNRGVKLTMISQTGYTWIGANDPNQSYKNSAIVTC